MEHGFWLERWREGKTAFHEGRPNDLLVKYAARLGEKRRVLVPLCGKAEDIAYLATLGHQVVGIELAEQAVQAFFEEHSMTPVVYRTEAHAVYSFGAITIIAGDFFAITPAIVGSLDALYDRAALVALPTEMRPRYVAHVRSLVEPGSPAFVVTYVHDLGDGPPFSVPDDEVRALYGAGDPLEERPDTRGRPGIERCWAMTLT